MSWQPNHKIGARGYYQRVCCIPDCLSKALYRVGVDGYCKAHYAIAQARVVRGHAAHDRRSVDINASRNAFDKQDRSLRALHTTWKNR